MVLVVDTNIFLAVALEEPEKNRIIDLTSGCDVVAPEILPYEIGNALSAMLKRKSLSEHEAVFVLHAIQAIAVRLLSVNVEKALKIAARFNIYAYDAYFLQCARSMSCSLLTLDKKMKQVALSLDIDTLE